jgi:serine/threonine protein kinase, bacterial
MSYCLSPTCQKPTNPDGVDRCLTCGSKLLLRDRYLPMRVLGRGGFGTTFLAVDAGLPGRPSCVIKQLRPVVSSPNVLEMARELFHREAETLGKIGSHPQLPRLLDFFEMEQEFYLVQEYVNGATLQQEVKRHGPLREPAVKAVIREVVPILDYLHGNEVIHRDIKPANLIRRSIDNKLVLIDFGAVKDQVNQAMAANPQEYSTLTAFAVGTPGFAPPEQMAMRPVYASDIYALGVTCLYLLTGKSPKDLNYDATTGELLWREHVQISEHFSNLLQKMLESSVRHRYQSMKEVQRALDLETHVDHLAQGMAAQPNSSPERSPSGRVGGVSPNSPAARSAMAIRSQQARSDSTGLPSVHGRSSTGRRTQGGDSSSDQSAFMSPSQASAAGARSRLDAAGLLAAYNRGQRDFTNQNLENIVLRKAQLAEAVFHQAQLQNADLRGADLFNANFGRASLNHSKLSKCNLSKAYMSHADLEGADLRGADLSYAYLSHANLRGANLCGANLTGASVSEAQLAVSRINWTTTLPNRKRGTGW